MVITGFIIICAQNFRVSAAESWLWPLENYGQEYITSKFGYRTPPTAGASSYHNGIDIGVPSGTPIRASKSGWIVPKGFDSARGYWVVIDHQDGTYSNYQHLSSYAISTQQMVRQGDIIGYVGSTGASTGAHLHFEIRTGERDKAGSFDSLTAQDPLKYSYIYSLQPSIYFDFWGYDDSASLSGVPKIWWKSVGYGNSNITITIGGYFLATTSSDSNGLFSYEFDTKQFNDGEYYLGATIKGANGQEKTVTKLIKIQNGLFYDFWGYDEGYTASDTAKIWWREIGFGDCNITVYLDDKVIIRSRKPDQNGYFSQEIWTHSYSNGMHQLKAVLTNTSGLKREITKKFNIYNYKYFDFEGYNENAVKSGNVTVKWRKTGYGDCKVKLYLDGKELSNLESDTNGYFSFNIDTNLYTNGSHTLKAVLSNVGGETVTRTKKFTIQNKAKPNDNGANVINITLAKKSFSTNQITMTWNAIPSLKYEVYRSNKKTSGFKLISTVSSGMYVDKTVKSGTAYYYQIKCTSVANNSNTLLVSTKPDKMSLSTKAGKREAILSWKKISGASGYEVYQSNSKNGKYKKVKTIAKNTTIKHTESRLSPNKKYYYKVRAYKLVDKEKVYGAFSKVCTVKVAKK